MNPKAGHFMLDTNAVSALIRGTDTPEAAPLSCWGDRVLDAKSLDEVFQAH